MNTPVSSPLAKLVSSKGFNEPCSSFYKDSELREVHSSVTNKRLVTNSQFMTSRCFTAPTVADVIMWLYEKHNIWISVDPENDINDTWFHTITHGKSITAFGNYTSPTEAYEKGIEHILTDLI